MPGRSLLVSLVCRLREPPAFITIGVQSLPSAAISPAHFDHRLVLFVVSGAKDNRVRFYNHTFVFFLFPLGGWPRHSVGGLAEGLSFFCSPHILTRARNEQSLKSRLDCSLLGSDQVGPGIRHVVYAHEEFPAGSAKDNKVLRRSSLRNSP